MNEHYIKTIDENELYDHLVKYCEIYKEKIKPEKETKIKPSLTFLKNKAKTLEDIFNNAKYIIFDDVKFEDKDLELIDDKAKNIIKEFKKKLILINTLNKETLEPIINDLIKKYETNFKGVGQPLRVALTGSKFGPGLYDIIISLGKEEVEKRLGNKIII
jgi:glutamyl-tRNA synthetase